MAPKGRFAIVVSRFHEHITNRLLDGALDCLRENDAAEIAVYYCPGSFELPQVANTLVKERIWDAIICLGVVIRGETSHFEYVASETARGIQDVALRSGVPVLLGVLTTENEQQALDRAGGKYGNKGRDAALAAVEMGALFEDLKRRREQVQ
ncbi:MAG: 6,7-dimethyl-8-ribityllumazine synthase [Ignavibacteriales bacterium]|nr:6,7-dimethyl-8-ribityllumazine synthase [Ignavibacteriales bacterium]